MFPCRPFQLGVALNFFLDTNMAELVTEMVNHYIPVDEDGSPTTSERVTKEYQVCRIFFFLVRTNHFLTQLFAIIGILHTPG